MRGRIDLRLAALSLALASLLPGPVAAGKGAVLESRPVGVFERVRLDGPADLEFTLGERHAVVVEAEPRLQARITLRIIDGELRFDLGEGAFQTRHRLRFHVSAPQLAGLTTAGSGDALLHRPRGSRFELTAGGSGDVLVEGVDAAELAIDHTGAGDVRMAGRCGTLAARSAESGNLALEALSCVRAHIRLEGSGDVSARISERLEADLDGSGDLTVIGHPSHHGHQTGIGELRFVGTD